MLSFFVLSSSATRHRTTKSGCSDHRDCCEGGGEAGLVRIAFARLFLNVSWAPFADSKFDVVSIMLLFKLRRPRMMPVDGVDGGGVGEHRL